MTRQTEKPVQLEIVRVCHLCKRKVIICADELEYKHWRSGQHIQDAMPGLSADEREILISGICGKCFDSLGGDE
jgi:hypothetical protein